jgi:hypothetical protein
MRCPSCDGQILKIQVLFQGYVTAFFQSAYQYELTRPVAMNSSWEEDSPCICENCEWQGSVAEALACGPASDFDLMDE